MTSRYILHLLTGALVLSSLSHAGISAPDQVTLHLKWFHQFQFAGYYAAKDKGFYTEEGLDVTIEERDISSSPVVKVVSGKAEFGIGDSSLILSRLKGDPLVAVAAIFQNSPLVLMSLAENQFVTPLDLHGKKVMYQGDVDGVILTAVFNEVGMTESDYSYVPHNFDDDVLLKGDIDAVSAYLTDQPFYYRNLGHPVNIIQPASYGIDFYGDVLFTREDVIKNSPSVVASMRRASIKGWQYALDNSEEIIQLILRSYNSRGKLTLDQLRYEADMTRRVIKPRLIEIGDINPGRFRQIAEFYKGQGMAPLFGKLDGIFYTDHINEQSQYSVWVRVILFAFVGFLILLFLLTISNRRLKRAVGERTEALARSQELLNNAGRLSHVGGWQLNLADYTLTWTEETYRIHEVPVGSPLDVQTAINFYAEDHRGAVIKAVDACISDGKAYDLELQLITASGKFIWARAIGQPKKNERGDIVAIYGVFQDITHLKELEDIKDKFVASVSHELRTPLTSIKGSVDLLINSDSVKSSHELTEQMLSVISRNSERLICIVNDLLDAEKLTAKAMLFRMETVDVEGLIEDAIHDNQPFGIERHISLVQENVPKDVHVKVDVMRFQQIMSNLISNAMKFSEDNSMVIVRCNLQPHRMTVSVIDKGIGIQQSKIHAVFDRFSQIHSDNAKKSYGTGLGLCISKMMVEQMDGEIGVRSAMGEGSTFFVSFPICAEGVESEQV